MEEFYQANRKQRKAGVAILVSDKKDFKSTKIRKKRALHNGKGINATRRTILKIYILLIWGGEFCRCLLVPLGPELSSSSEYPC